jgi:gliding motility-associated lipoprotein GldB
MVSDELEIVNRQFSMVSRHWAWVIRQWSIVAVLFLFASCKSRKPDVSNISVDLKVERFEQELFAIDSSNRDQAIQQMTEKYGEFFYFYFNGYPWNMQSESDQSWKDSVLAYVRDPFLTDLCDSVQKRFADISGFQKQLEASLKYFKYYFPSVTIPGVYTVINSPGHGAFTYGDSVLCVSLEDYMDPRFSFYKYLDIPNYLVRRFKPEYMVPNALQVMITKEFPFDPTSKKLLDAMVYNGKVMYLKSQFMPDAADSITTGFSELDLKWCLDNEKEIWKFFLTKDLLYSTDPLEYMKYVNDGPTTSGMPPESPGNVGSWVGWRIVSAYMKQHTEVSLQQLMEEQDAQKILRDSKYKP